MSVQQESLQNTNQLHVVVTRQSRDSSKLLSQSRFRFFAFQNHHQMGVEFEAGRVLSNRVTLQVGAWTSAHLRSLTVPMFRIRPLVVCASHQTNAPTPTEMLAHMSKSVHASTVHLSTQTSWCWSRKGSLFCHQQISAGTPHAQYTTVYVKHSRAGLLLLLFFLAILQIKKKKLCLQWQHKCF